MTREPNPYAKEPALTVNKAVLMSVPSIVAEDVLDGLDVVDAQHQKNADIHVSSADREKWDKVADSIDGKLEDLQLDILGEEFEDTLHWSDPAVECTHAITYMDGSPIPGFEEPVERDSCIRALRLFSHRQEWVWVTEEFEYYCIFTSYSPSGEITGTARGVFVITKQDAYVEFDTPLDVFAGGKIKFEFGGYYIPDKDDLGLGGAMAFGAYKMTSGWIVKKVGARLLGGVSSPSMPFPSSLPEIPDHTLFRTIYYKTTGAVDEKIAKYVAEHPTPLPTLYPVAPALTDESTAPTATGVGSLAIGVEATASGSHSVTLGSGAAANSDYSIALGDGANTKGVFYSCALGAASVADSQATAVGGQATASKSGSIAVGWKSDANAANALAVGKSAIADITNSIAIGDSVKALNENAIAVGSSAKASGASSIAMGPSAQAKGNYSVALGAGAQAAAGGVAIGPNVRTQGMGIAFGYGDLSDTTPSVGDGEIVFFGLREQDTNTISNMIVFAGPLSPLANEHLDGNPGIIALDATLDLNGDFISQSMRGATWAELLPRDLLASTAMSLEDESPTPNILQQFMQMVTTIQARKQAEANS